MFSYKHSASRCIYVIFQEEVGLIEFIELKLNFLRTINNSLPFQAWILI